MAAARGRARYRLYPEPPAWPRTESCRQNAWWSWSDSNQPPECYGMRGVRPAHLVGHQALDLEEDVPRATAAFSPPDGTSSGLIIVVPFRHACLGCCHV